MAELKLSTLSNDDIGLYFNSSYVRVLGLHETRRWHRYKGFSKDGSLSFEYATKDIVTLPQDVWKKQLIIDSKFPVGAFNFRKTVLFGTRIPVRHVGQGLSGQNFKLTSAEELYWDLPFARNLPSEVATFFQVNMLKESKPKWFGKILDELFEQSTYPKDVAKAIDEVRRGAAFARALTRELSVMPHPSSKGVLVFYDQFPIGECLKAGTIQALYSEFFIELHDFFSSHNISIKEAK